MVYRVVTKTNKIPYIVNYQCENCLSNNTDIYVTKAQSSYSTKRAFTNSSIESLDKNADIELEDNTKKAIDETNALIESKNYTKLHLTCKCKKCGKIPAWSFNKVLTTVIGVAKELCVIVSAIVFVISLAALLKGDTESFLKILGIAAIIAVPALAGYIYDIVSGGTIKKRISGLDPKFLPEIKLAFQFQEKMVSDTHKKLKNIVTSEYCKKCGEKLPNNSAQFCEFCGAKVERRK